MTVVGIYSIHNMDDYRLMRWLESKRKIVRPYALITSQWQRWNLFSPDPLRRVTEMEFDIYQHGSWNTVHAINNKTVPLPYRANELKVMRRMEDDDKSVLREIYTRDVCKRLSILPGTRMRIRKKYYIIPKHTELQSITWWREWEPKWREDIVTEISCPPVS